MALQFSSLGLYSAAKASAQKVTPANPSAKSAHSVEVLAKCEDFDQKSVMGFPIAVSVTNANYSSKGSSGSLTLSRRNFEITLQG